MSALYLDTSALAKRYLLETGSAWVRSITHADTGNTVWISRAATVEMTSAICRRLREGTLSEAEADDAERTLQADISTAYHLVEFNAEVAERAMRLLRSHPLRAYDGIQLASAILLGERMATAELPPIAFVCADDRLCSAADAEGLRTEDPGDHP